MSDNIKLLDCTLREAPLDGLMWGDLAIHKIIHGLENAMIDIIEVGFLKNASHLFGSTSFQKVEEIVPYLNNKDTPRMYVALVDYGRYDLKYLSDYDGKSIDAIRICFKHNEIEKVLDYATAIREKGYKVCIQHVDTMGFSDNEIINFIEKVNRFKPYAYSVVDTFGAMYTSDSKRYTELANKYLDEEIRLGFHAHNNLMLADANAQSFVENLGIKRNIIVDTSLYGCGRSAGNAHTELMVQYMNRVQKSKYDLDEILDLIDTVITSAREKTQWGYNIPYFIAGIHNAHTFNVKQLLKRHNLKSKDLRSIIERLDDTQKKAYDYTLLEKLYVEYFNKPVDDKLAISQLTRNWKDKNILLLAPGKSVHQNRFELNEFISRNKPVVIAINNLIDGYKLDYIFYSSAVRYHNLQYQDYKTAGSPQIILTSNIKTTDDSNELIISYNSLIKYGWINIDSSAILLLRLIQKCGVNEIFVAGLDGYSNFGQAFYKNELDTGLDEATRMEHNQENISMLRDMKESNPELDIHFLTDSVYSSIFSSKRS